MGGGNVSKKFYLIKDGKALVSFSGSYTDGGNGTPFQFKRYKDWKDTCTSEFVDVGKYTKIWVEGYSDSYPGDSKAGIHLWAKFEDAKEIYDSTSAGTWGTDYGMFSLSLGTHKYVAAFFCISGGPSIGYVLNLWLE